jgi:3-oxoacyl-[acyl-carrier protein] reductase
MKGQIALVTGGSRGIGRAISVALAQQGTFVYVNYTSQSSAAEDTVALCRAAGGDGAAIQFDVASSASVDAAIDQIKEKSGKIDILVNNAGISKDGLLMRLKDEDWDRTLQVNLNGAFYCTRAVTRLMMRAKYGRIINISSVVGEMGNAGQAAYVASKAGLIGFTKSVARELASRNITANVITPGFIETDMTQGLAEELKEAHLTAIPLGRYGSADEIASAVLYFASPGASYITGQVLGVNGGMYM